MFGQNINTISVINDMVNAYLNNGCPMIALMRISIVCKDGKVVHHNVPYVFVSGDSGSNAINRWTKIPNRYISQYPNLYSAINQKTGYGDNLEIYSAVKGINDYKFWCESNFSQSYSHAERACVLALMSDEHHSLKNVIHWSQQFNAFTQTLEAVNGNVSKVVIQIKISHKIGAVCNECYRFLTGNAHWTNEQSKDNSCNYKFTNDTYPDIFLTKERLRDLGQGGLISIFIPIEIRISSNGLDGCCCTAASFNY